MRYGYTITHNISKIDSYPVKSDNNQDKNLVRFFFQTWSKVTPFYSSRRPFDSRSHWLASRNLKDGEK